MEITLTLTSSQAAAMFLRFTNIGLTLPEGLIAHARELRAALPHVEAPAAAPAPRKAAPTAGLFDMFGGDDPEDDAANE